MLKTPNFILLCAIITILIEPAKLNATYETGEDWIFFFVLSKF